MHSPFAPLPLAALLDLGGQMIGLLVVLTTLTLSAVVAVAALYFHHQRRRLWHDTARIALEKGQPLPPQPPSWEDPATVLKAVSDQQWTKSGRRKQPRWLRDLRGGLVMLAIGGGIYLALARAGQPPLLLIAAYVPGFIGAALVLNALISAIFSPKESEVNPAPPPRDAS